MKVLVTGATGFVGPHLVHYLQSLGHEVYGMDRHSVSRDRGYSGDITDRDFVSRVVKDVLPDSVFHLAGYSSVKNSFQDAELVHKVNVDGTQNVLEAMSSFVPQARLLYVSSAVVYGTPLKLPISETDELRPGSPYAQSRVDTEEMLRHYQLPWIVTRSFNHTGPGQTADFVLSDWCRQAAAIELGLQLPLIKVGNIKAVRDFIDVRDIVRVYTEILISGEIHQIYNIGSGIGYHLGDLLKMILSFISVPVEVAVDSEKVRVQDTTMLVADTSKLISALPNYCRKYRIEDTLQDILIYWRKELSR